jgi:hypothetical protein
MRARWKRGGTARQVDHRRRQHHAVEPALAGMRHPQHHLFTGRSEQIEKYFETVRALRDQPGINLSRVGTHAE